MSLIHLRSSRVCPSLIALCFVAGSAAQSAMAPGAIRKGSGQSATYAMITVNDCKLSADARNPASEHGYRAGDIRYSESASGSWKNSGDAEAHVVLVEFH